MKAENKTWAKLTCIEEPAFLDLPELEAEELVEEEADLEPLEVADLEPEAEPVALAEPVELPPVKVTESVALLVPMLPISFKAEAQPAWVVASLKEAEPLKSQLDLEPPWLL